MFTIFRGGNIGEGEYFYKGDDLQISEQFVKENTILKKNCYITPSVTSIEHIGKLALIDRDLNNTVAGGFVLIIYPVLKNADLLKYFLFALSSKYHKDNCKKITNKSGQAFYNLSREKLMQLIIPLPPLAEQTRIAEKIRQFLPYINNYNSIYSKIESLNANYKDELKKSILQYAIQGKPVKQDLNDEPADVLINKILDEKRELIKTKQIKKEKLSVIYKDSADNQFYEKFDDGKIFNITDEIPFDLPNNWSWIRFKNICKVITCGYASTPKYENSGIPFISAKNVKPYKFMPEDHKFISEELYKKLTTNFKPEKNDILLTRVGAGIGEAAIIDTDFDFAIYVSLTLIKLLNYEKINNKYILNYILSPYGLSTSISNIYGKGASQGNLNVNNVRDFLVPIPPLNEQFKIVLKIEQLLNLIQ